MIDFGNNDEPTILDQISASGTDIESVDPDGDVLKKISPGKWESLISVLEFLTKDSDDSVIIEDSVIMHSLKSGGILRVNLTEIFDGERINLHISSPKKWTRLFKQLKGDNVFIINEDNRFVVTNGQIKLFLPKQLNSVVAALSFPNFDETSVISNFVMQKDTRDKILNLGKNINYIEFLIQNEQLKCINIPNTAVFILPEFIKDPAVKDLTPDNADIVLRGTSFLPYSSETYQITIGTNSLNGSHFIFSTCTAQLMKIEVFEPLDNASGVNSLF